jgi:tetratricopeptide (TPR) repeat protein
MPQDPLTQLNHRIERARRSVRRDPAVALAASEEAVRLAGALDDRNGMPPSVVRDQRARAWAYRGNVLRVTGDLPSANDAFSRSADQLGDGSGSPVVAARRRDLLASLRFAEDRREEACQLLESAVEDYRQLGVEHALGRALLKKAHFLIAEDRQEEVVVLLRDALEAIPAHRDSESFCLAAVGLAYSLDRLGYSGAASGLVTSLKGFRRTVGDQPEVLRLTWLETRLARNVGGERRAEVNLQALQASFLDAGLPYEAVRVSLDLAGMYFEQGRHFDLRRLSLSLFPLFQNRLLGREAMAALIFFRERLATGPLDRELIGDLERYFERSQRDANLRFEPRPVRWAASG